jgi:hypothetical protein
LAVDGSHLYWASSDGTIGRANLDGTGVNNTFITGASRPCGVAVDGAHIYWASDAAAGTIGRAKLDGTGVNQSFITGATFACGVAVDAGHVYWANDGATGTIGRANLDGTGVNQSFLTGANFPCGVAVDGLPSPPPSPPSNQFSFGKPKRNLKRGATTLPVSVPGPGGLALAGKGVMAASAVRVNAGRAQATVRLLIAARGGKRKQLNRTGKVTVNPKVTYTPDGGNPSTRSTKLTLVKR